MPARRGRGRPITNIPYNRMQQSVNAMHEISTITNQMETIYTEQEESRHVLSKAVEVRVNAQESMEVGGMNNKDIKSYLTKTKAEKDKKARLYQSKLNQLRQEREVLVAKLQADLDQLKQAHELEITQLTNALKANKIRRDNLATIAALEIQLKREIDEAESTLNREKIQQSKQLSSTNAEYNALRDRHEEELRLAVEKEKAKNRGMTSENLERTVIEMMREIDQIKKKLTADVGKAQQIANENSELMTVNKQLYMERDLLQKETDEVLNKIKRNDTVIRKLVEELKNYDQRFSTDLQATTISEEAESAQIASESEEEEAKERSMTPPSSPPPASPQNAGPDREALLQQFFQNSIEVLCDAVIRVLGVIDSQHAEDYTSFHGFFADFEGRKKELRFLMSKLGNLTSTVDDTTLLPPIGLEDIEGADEDYTQKHLIDPQQKAIMEFSEPIADDEFPELIATHFFQ